MSGGSARAGNIGATLTAAARERPHAMAVACPSGRDGAGRTAYSVRTFAQLDRESDRLARGLTAVGIGRGVRSALLVRPGHVFFALTFALFKAGAVPVLIDPGIGVRNFGGCLAAARPGAFLGVPKAQVARRLLGWGRETVRVAVTVRPIGREIAKAAEAARGSTGCRNLSLAAVAAAGSEEPFAAIEPEAEETAAILFTSGSTGPPKGVIYTHDRFGAQVRALRSMYGIEPGEIDLCTFPLFALFAPALGMTSIVPEMDATRPAQVDPTRIIEAVQSFGATNLFGSPALIRRVAEYGAARAITLPTLRRVISAGAPVPSAVIERCVTMLSPGVQVFTPYGATEALPVCSIGSEEILGATRAATDRGEGVCVGRPAAGMRVEVIPISDAPIERWSEDLVVAEGTVGEIVVRGPVVTSGYFGREEATRLAKIGDGDAIWHRMGDLGARDREGRFWFCGRKSHRVETERGVLFTIPCEAVFNTHPAVARTALVGVGPAGRMRPVLCVEPRVWSGSRSERERMVAELRAIGARYEHTSEIVDFLFHRGFPVDVRHNAKIRRESLADWASRRVR